MQKINDTINNNNGSICIPLNPILGSKRFAIQYHPWSFMHVFTCLTGRLPIVLQLALTLRLVTCVLLYQVPTCTCTLLGGERQELMHAVPTCIP